MEQKEELKSRLERCLKFATSDFTIAEKDLKAASSRLRKVKKFAAGLDGKSLPQKEMTLKIKAAKELGVRVDSVLVKLADGKYPVGPKTHDKVLKVLHAAEGDEAAARSEFIDLGAKVGAIVDGIDELDD